MCLPAWTRILISVIGYCISFISYSVPMSVFDFRMLASGIGYGISFISYSVLIPVSDFR